MCFLIIHTHLTSADIKYNILSSCNAQTISLQYPHADFLQSTTSYDSSVQFSAVDTYASYLKSVYTREKQPLYKWMKVKPKKYIHLTLIKRGTLQNKRLINL